jgi:ABC-type multidrug transport system ATPase subunit
MIDVVNVWHHYGVRPVLRDISLRVETGEVVVVMGPNGMGKSTLLGVIAGLLSPIQGYVEIDGLRRRRNEEEENAIRRRTYYLPDNPWLPQHLTVREFVLAVGRVYRVDERRLMDHADRLLALFDLTAQGEAPIRACSTGQKKKVGICSSLITDAPVLVMDEPFSGGLDSSALLALRGVMTKLAEGNDRTLVLAVPVPELVEGFADRIAVIKDGKIEAYDSPARLREATGAASLPEALERIVHPQSESKLDQYFRGGQA